MRFKNSVAVAAGGALGFLASLLVGALLLGWSARVWALVVVLGFAAFFILRRGDKPRKRAYLYAGGFVLGYALFVALLLVLDAVFPPLT